MANIVSTPYFQKTPNKSSGEAPHSNSSVHDQKQNISKTSSSIYLLRKIRDEVHRFSVSYHRSLRNKGMTKSLLSNVNGLGEKRIKLLWKYYDSFSDILKESIEDIKSKTSIPISIIKEIKIAIKKELHE